tara:strand:+ start:880 stop:1059 length:180 start_codon:yes stop_codon:yes gene_type:complete
MKPISEKIQSSYECTDCQKVSDTKLELVEDAANSEIGWPLCEECRAKDHHNKTLETANV